MYAKILPFTYTDALSYKIPNELTEIIKIGQVVEIPLGDRAIKGIVLGLTNNQPAFKTKKIIYIINPTPLFTEKQIALAKWVSYFYFSSLYQVIKNMNIKNLEKHLSEIRIKPNYNKQSLIRQTGKKYILYTYDDKKISFYLKAISKCIKNNKQALLIFPDNISLENFSKIISEKRLKTATLTSKLNKKEKSKEWLKIRNDEVDLIIGTRTAIFSPFQNLGLIIIDKEYEDGHKQEKTPRYKINEIAEYLQKITRCNLILQTDIQTLENFYRNKNGYKNIKSGFIAKKPEIIILDIRGNREFIDTKIEQLIQKNFKSGKKNVFFLNRKGKDTVIMCPDCNFTFTCPSCNIPLTSTEQFLLCNHCGFKKEIPIMCSNCGSKIIKRSGIGTEKLEIKLKAQFPKAKILRVDERNKKNFDNNKIKNADIIVGTQMIKMIDFKKVGLLIFFSVDSILNLPTYQAEEKAQKIIDSLISKINQDTKVIIRTANTENPLINVIKKQNYFSFFENKLKNLKDLHYPPFCDLIQIIFRGNDDKKINKQIREIKEHLKKYEIIGPFSSYISDKNGKSRKVIIVKTEKNKVFYDKIFRSMKNISIERNPESLI
ncbi:primosomal protein N' [bacterium CG2_30_33_46]|nr:MAG: primosomal protein N' [bacterium CG2_30_33_46]